MATAEVMARDLGAARSHDAEAELEIVEIWIFEGDQYAVDALFPA